MILVFLSFLVLVSYANSLGNAFLSDDISEIVQNKNLANLGHILSHPLLFLRPLLYFLAFQIGGLNPAIFRSINILFHLGSVILIYYLIKKLEKPTVAFFTASIFAVHPLMVEAVSWISGGGYPQYSFFLLAAFLTYLLSSKDGRFYILSVIFFIFALITHAVMASIFPIILLLYEYSFSSFKKHFKKLVVFFLLSIFWGITILASVSERTATLQTVHYQKKGEIDNLLILVPVAVSSYFELLFYPANLTLYHSELFFTPFKFALMAIFTLSLLISIGYLFFKNKKLFFYLSFFVVSLAPTLTPFKLNWIVAERYAYLPSLAIFTIFGLAFSKLSSDQKLKKWSWMIFFAIILVLMIRTIVRNNDWQSEDKLWVATVKLSPSSPNSHNNMGDVYARHGNLDMATQEFQKAIELKPNYADAYHNLANTYQQMGKLDLALENYTKATVLAPYLWQSNQNIAVIYYQKDELNLAEGAIKKAILINPNNLNLKLNLAIIYLKANKSDEAKEILEEILKLDPKNQKALLLLQESSKKF